MKERDNILRILKETKQAMQEENYSKIKSLSNQTINTASLTQDPDNIIVAVIVYSLNKIFQNKDKKEFSKKSRFYKKTVRALDYSIEDIEKNNITKFRKDFEKIRKELTKVSGKLKSHIEDVFRKASINKASKLYEHGISMERTASLLGITMYELANYSGQRETPKEVPDSETISAKKRIKTAMDFFK